MAPSRKSVSGRSPLVNKQHQITAFFSKSTTQNPNPNPNSSPPATPSPINAKTKPKTVTPTTTQKPQLVIGTNVEYGEEVVGRRVRVYWPMDEEWYEGCVKGYDEKRVGGKMHLVEYDDGEEEFLDLGKEKVEWVEEGGSVGRRRKLRRLRQVAVVLDDDSEVEEVVGEKDSVGDSSDEDWKGVVEVEEEEEKGLEGMELEEEEVGEEKAGSVKRKRVERRGEDEKAGVEVSVSKKKKGGVSEFFGKVGGKEKVMGGSSEGQGS